MTTSAPSADRATLFHTLYGDLISLESILSTKQSNGYAMTQSLVFKSADALGVTLPKLTCVANAEKALTKVRTAAKREGIKVGC